MRQLASDKMTKICFKLFILTLLISSYEAVNNRYYPRYHFAPPHGWMNDPNGFCVFKDEYHLFYQYNPGSSQEPGIACWGHAKSKDLFHWEHLPIAMYPDTWYDKTGVFSGSALIEDDIMYLYYTGNVNHPNESPSHTEYQALATSSDGVNVEKYEGNPIINATNHQPDIRDPKVWQHRDRFYMVLGNSYENGTRGRVLMYSSKDKLSWDKVTVIQPETLGYMWECPDLFEIDGKFVLLFSPQGLKAQGDNYKNLYQTGYIIGNLDHENNLFTALTDFKELDHGHDFYATQTILDKLGRRLLVAWFDMWEQVYPERNDGWTGQMTLIRQLTLTTDNKLIQKPVIETLGVIQNVLYKGNANEGEVFRLEDKSGLVSIQTSVLKDFSVVLESENRNNSVVISYDCSQGHVTLDRGGDDGVRRTKWRPREILKWHIYVDASSVELFCGDGEVTFSSRFFPDGPVQLRMGDGSVADELILSSIKRTVPVPEN